MSVPSFHVLTPVGLDEEFEYPNYVLTAELPMRGYIQHITVQQTAGAADGWLLLLIPSHVTTLTYADVRGILGVEPGQLALHYNAERRGLAYGFNPQVDALGHTSLSLRIFTDGLETKAFTGSCCVVGPHLGRS